MPRAETLRSWAFEDCLLLVRRGRRGIYALNQTAAYIWELVQSGASEQEAARELAAAYGIDAGTASRDVGASIRDWRSQGLLGSCASEPISEPASPILDAGEGIPSVTRYLMAGVRFTVTLPNEDLSNLVEPRLAPFRRDDSAAEDVALALVPDGANTVILRRNGTAVARESGAGILVALMSEIARICFPGSVCSASLHAAAVGRDGKCVLFAGPSGAGKSTLSAALSCSGFDVLTDDALWLEQHSVDVLGLPLALKLREGSWPVLLGRFPEIPTLQEFRRKGQTVKYLCLRHPGEPARAAGTALVFAHFDPRHSALLRPVSAFDSLVGLQNSGFWVEDDEEAIRTFLHWLDRIPKFDLRWSDGNAVASLLPQLLKGLKEPSKNQPVL